MKIIKKILPVILSVIMVMAMTPGAAFATIVPHTGTNFNAAIYCSTTTFNFDSTNGHFVVSGLFIDNDKNAYLILQLRKNSSYKDIAEIDLSLSAAGAGRMGFTDPEVYVLNDSTTMTVTTPVETATQENSFGFLVVKLGDIGKIAPAYFLDLVTTNGQGGWNVSGMEFDINMDYDIEKTVDETLPYRTGDTVKYTVTVENSENEDGSAGYAIPDITVKDDVPAGLQITKVDGSTDFTVKDGDVILDEDLTLDYLESKSYEIEAVITDDNWSKDITNTATIESYFLLPKSDDATITVNSYFDVKHQATGETDRIRLGDLEDGSFDITEKLGDGSSFDGVTEGYIYGGIATTDGFGTPKTDVCGKELKPSDGDIYYLREVKNTYLRPATLFVWGVDEGVYTTDAYLITALDKDGVSNKFYTAYGMMVNGSTKLPASIEVKSDSTQVVDTYYLYDSLTVDNSARNRADVNYGIADLFPSLSEDNSYFGCIKYDNYDGYKYSPYYVTADKVVVTGTKTRTIGAYDSSKANPDVSTSTTGSVTTKDAVKKMLSKMVAVPNPKYLTAAPEDVAENSGITVTVKDGDKSSSMNLEPGNLSGQLQAEPKTGKLFAGWYLDSEFKTPADLSDVQNDITVYSKYVSDNYYLVKINKKNLVMAVDEASCKECGFLFNVDGKESKTVLKKSATKVNGSDAASLFGLSKKTKLASAAYNAKDYSKAKNATVTPYYITADGTVMFTETLVLK